MMKKENTRAGKIKIHPAAIGAVVFAVLAVLHFIWTVWEVPSRILPERVTAGVMTRLAPFSAHVLSETERNTLIALYNQAEKKRVEGIPVDAEIEVRLTQDTQTRAVVFYHTAQQEIYMMRYNQFLNGVCNDQISSEELADFLDQMLLDFKPDRL